MIILLDTNVIFTFISQRDDKYLNEAKNIINKCLDKELDGAIAFHSLSTIWYLLRDKSFETRLRLIRFICSSFKVAHADNATILEAMDNTAFRDFEDNLQDCCAQSVGAAYIVTANVRDYDGHSAVKAVTPSELLSILNASDTQYTAHDSALEVHEPHVEYITTENAPLIRPHLHIIAYPTAC